MLAVTVSQIETFIPLQPASYCCKSFPQSRAVWFAPQDLEGVVFGNLLRSVAAGLDLRSLLITRYDAERRRKSQSRVGMVDLV